jgi:osmotically-inducible protein OsmY
MQAEYSSDLQSRQATCWIRPPLTEDDVIETFQLDDQVLTALEQSPYVPGRTLRFETADGRVTLRGVVKSYYQKQMAQEAIRHLSGVREIANELEVSWA